VPKIVPWAYAGVAHQKVAAIKTTTTAASVTGPLGSVMTYTVPPGCTPGQYNTFPCIGGERREENAGL